MAKVRIQPMARHDHEDWLLGLVAQSETLSFSGAVEMVFDTHPMFIRHKEKIESDEKYSEVKAKQAKQGAKIRAENKRR